MDGRRTCQTTTHLRCDEAKRWGEQRPPVYPPAPTEWDGCLKGKEGTQER